MPSCDVCFNVCPSRSRCVETIKDTTMMVAMKCEYETVPKLSIGAIFNYFERLFQGKANIRR